MQKSSAKPVTKPADAGLTFFVTKHPSVSANYTSARPKIDPEARMPQDVILSGSQPIHYTRGTNPDTGNPNQRQP